MGNVQIIKYNKKDSFIAYNNFNIREFIYKYNNSGLKIHNIKIFIYYEKIYTGKFSPIVLKIFKNIMPNLEKIIIKKNISTYKSKNDIIFNIKNI